MSNILYCTFSNYAILNINTYAISVVNKAIYYNLFYNVLNAQLPAIVKIYAYNITDKAYNLIKRI